MLPPAETVLVINVRVLNQRLILQIQPKLTLQPISKILVTLALIVVLSQLQTQIAIQMIYAARQAYVLSVANNLNNDQHLLGLIQRSDYCLSRQSYRQSCYLLSYLCTRGALQRLTNPRTEMLPTASMCSTYLSIRTVDLLVIYGSVIQSLIPRCAFKPKTYLASLLSLIYSIRLLRSKIFALHLRHLITLKRADF